MIKQLYRFFNPRFQNLFLEYPVAFKPRYGHGLPPHPELWQLVNAHRNTYDAFIAEAISLLPYLSTIADATVEKDAKKPVWNNGFLPGLDIVGIYLMLTHFQPKRYVEVGSGNSTKVAHKAKLEQHLNTQIISVDPQPRAEIDAIADTIYRMPFEDSQLNLPELLEPGDILFIDNSHRMLPNSDATVFFMEVLPRLQPGVIVQIHDIYIPYDYPQDMCDRFYSEQYGLAINLLANPEAFEILLPNFFISEDPELSQACAPLWKNTPMDAVEKHGGSFWFRKKK
ncbi:MAG: class I SAM-dependent methyltransferase [Schleiferiaceae bacterium]|nr:class I SAM-dependent methyltransferase [Schleiferiaceae bacterium]